ncbi:hypothetical protein G1H11_16085 [Phytoactinopolyspora alkaliphila]|uniref:Uncharacterized protein n=1 Tax=Phytoactinopolyspora alkaliphila TaxID=1783498 RepID=A0A6N9YPQ6_9ACTN|nr:hypothetical protein [Phytoactinopolyspora alkaliphila]NED96828.1 hypothetical protein [Phytoactinopolyspora alkaliphila]
MKNTRFVSGLWEHVNATDRSGGGYLTTYEVAARTRDEASLPHAAHSDRHMVTRDVMMAIVERQTDLHNVPRPVAQRDSFPTPAGEAFPLLDYLSWDGHRVRVEFRHVIEVGDDKPSTVATGHFHLAPDADGLYHLNQLGWDLHPVPRDSRMLRPVSSTLHPAVDDMARRAVDAVENGDIGYGAASRVLLRDITVMARRPRLDALSSLRVSHGQESPSRGVTL